MPPFIETFERWYRSLKVVRANEGPANGTLAAALVVLERLKTDYRLDLSAHTAKGGMQISGASGKAVADLLERFGETRPFAKEGGRTNRGGPGEIKAMLSSLAELELEKLTMPERNSVLVSMQLFLVERVREFHNRQRITLNYDFSRSTWHTIQALLERAKEAGKAGPVAQHLVGAKLEIRFPGLIIQNESFSTADTPTGRNGDFLVGDTVFHVTVAPMPAVYQKCFENVQDGYRVYLLVSDHRLIAARQNSLDTCGGRITVESIESFVSQNVEELGSFAKQTSQQEFAHLLHTYNRRVNEVEIDKSLLVELPPALLK